MTLVYPNYYTDPARFHKTKRLCETYKLEVTDQLTSANRYEVEYIINKTRYIDDEFVQQFPNLKAVVILGTEAWMVDLKTSAVRIVCIDEDRGYEVAEHAVALLLATVKRLNRIKEWRYRCSLWGITRSLSSRKATETRGAHNWARVTTDTLYQKRIGIIGYGLIGHEIRKRLMGYNAKFFYYSRSPYPKNIEHNMLIRYLDLESLFGECDIIFVQLPLTSETEGLISAKQLKNCRNSLVLVNCGRAAVIDRQALYEALKCRKIQYYAADVFWDEPMPLLTKFRFLRNCWITPHMAESLPNRRQDLLEKALRKIVQCQEQ